MGVFLTAWNDRKLVIMHIFSDYEVEKLKQAVESLMATNEEKVGRPSWTNEIMLYELFISKICPMKTGR